MGLGFSIDTPLKVAKYGISSVVSIVDDSLTERMRAIHASKFGLAYEAITEKMHDYRANRITAYLNQLDVLVHQQFEQLKAQAFEAGSEIMKYYEMLPSKAELKICFDEMMQLSGEAKLQAQEKLRQLMQPGSIDVNIMVKVDKTNHDKQKNPLPIEFNDGHASLRGFAQSTLASSMILSAGMNPRLYSYIEQFSDFFPNAMGEIKKKIILKVSDFRSALIQGKMLAKKGLWVSEFRIESGLNCGGHAFATDGLLLGPILEEFAKKRDSLKNELLAMYHEALKARELPTPEPVQRLTVQGGIGTHAEHEFMMQEYQADACGWGSPFLLVPEATNVDTPTLRDLASAEPEDFYLSDASPLGVPFNNFKKASAHTLLAERAAKGRPGSPCHKKFLQSNTEYTDIAICTASRQYLHAKEKELRENGTFSTEPGSEWSKALEKDCLCEGLSAPGILVNGEIPAHNITAVSICPGPNLQFYSGIFSLKEMVSHIYGRFNALNHRERPHSFINELKLYVDYLKRELNKVSGEMDKKQVKYFETFKQNMLEGIAYYRELASKLYDDMESAAAVKFRQALDAYEDEVQTIVFHQLVPVTA